MADKKIQGSEIARKITISTIAGKAAEWFEELMKVKQMDLLTIYGYASGAKADASEFGEYVKLFGNFRAINAKTGEITNSPQAILPTFIGQAMAAALANPDRAGSMKFAFAIGVKLDLAASTKYTYTIRDIMPPTVDDPLASLGVALGLEQPLALAAPVVDAEVAVEAEAAPAPATGKKR